MKNLGVFFVLCALMSITGLSLSAQSQGNQITLAVSGMT